jgi:hypothetical protein
VSRLLSYYDLKYDFFINRPMNFMTELATNATARGVDIILYSGNDDALVAHRGTERLSLCHSLK